jgi:hypothetical protein
MSPQGKLAASDIRKYFYQRKEKCAGPTGSALRSLFEQGIFITRRSFDLWRKQGNIIAYLNELWKGRKKRAERLPIKIAGSFSFSSFFLGLLQRLPLSGAYLTAEGIALIFIPAWKAFFLPMFREHQSYDENSYGTLPLPLRGDAHRKL